MVSPRKEHSGATKALRKWHKRCRDPKKSADDILDLALKALDDSHGGGRALLARGALVLMTRDAGDLLHLGNLRDLGLVLLVFGLQGTSLTCLRWVEYAALSDDQPKFLMVTGLVAGTWGTLLLLLKRRRPQRGEIATGAGSGVYNMVALIVILTALSQVPGTIFFPLMGCTVVVLDNLAARFLWREPWAPTTLAGVALALMAILVVL